MIRNFIVDTFRCNPTRYLTVVACRRNLEGDVVSIIKIHSFLEQWGLINFQVSPRSVPSRKAPARTLVENILIETPTGIKRSMTIKPEHVSKEVENHVKSIEISPAVQMSPMHTLGLRLEKYIPQKTLKGIHKFKDDWNQVSRHVGTRTQEECILEFIKLPIEDSYTDKNISPHLSTIIPIMKMENPVMCLISFLSLSFDPKIASEAAKTMLEEFGALKNKERAEDKPALNYFTDHENLVYVADKGLKKSIEKTKEMIKRDISKLRSHVLSLVDCVAKRLELKVKFLEGLDDIFNKEREVMLRQKEQLMLERLRNLQIMANSTTIPQVNPDDAINNFIDYGLDVMNPAGFEAPQDSQATRLKFLKIRITL
ncbi:SWI/SNF complex subunit SMARCC2 [Thelohanellus kitauei]|uniref:SWI/SNF complex subunit SMARCC2 n=1 Tax=Thelohanellus kitauei TaxID=669202 RepID=A0A0C2NJM0_THEKT|nr:SWI/SNF complex subunit SMARCC2 [Thelohanellus kitauei]